MLKKLPVILCLGSSCFARGNQELITIIRKFIVRHQLEDKVEFKGDHCFHDCSDGPNMMIGARLFQHLDTNNIEEFLFEGLDDLINKN